jgi:hypothetical protein
MPSHNNAAAKQVVIGVKTCNGAALLWREKPFHYGVTLMVQISSDLLPVKFP